MRLPDSDLTLLGSQLRLVGSTFEVALTRLLDSRLPGSQLRLAGSTFEVGRIEVASLVDVVLQLSS